MLGVFAVQIMEWVRKENQLHEPSRTPFRTLRMSQSVVHHM